MMREDLQGIDLDRAFQAFEYGQLFARSPFPDRVRREFKALCDGVSDEALQSSFDEGVAFERALSPYNLKD